MTTLRTAFHITVRAGCMGAIASALLATSALVATPAVAVGDDPTLRSRHERWEVYVQELDGDRLCYAITEPSDSAPSNVEHGNVGFLVASWRSGAATEQPMLSVGYPLRLGAPTSARVGSDRFKMFTDGADAFIEADADEPRLVRAMKRGYTLRLETVSQRGTQTTYEFSLRGVTAALRAVDDAC